MWPDSHHNKRTVGNVVRSWSTATSEQMTLNHVEMLHFLYCNQTNIIVQNFCTVYTDTIVSKRQIAGRKDISIIALIHLSSLHLPFYKHFVPCSHSLSPLRQPVFLSILLSTTRSRLFSNVFPRQDIHVFMHSSSVRWAIWLFLANCQTQIVLGWRRSKKKKYKE